MGLILWGLSVLILIALIVYGIIQLIGDQGTTSNPKTTTTTPSTTTTTVATATPSSTPTTTTTTGPATSSAEAPEPGPTHQPTQQQPTRRHHWPSWLPTTIPNCPNELVAIKSTFGGRSEPARVGPTSADTTPLVSATMARHAPADYFVDDDPTVYIHYGDDDHDGAEPDPNDPIPGWRKPIALAGWGILIAILIALIVWGIIQLAQGTPPQEPVTGTTP